MESMEDFADDKVLNTDNICSRRSKNNTDHGKLRRTPS